MQFERLADEPLWAKMIFIKEERSVLNDALVKLLADAALEGNAQFPIGSTARSNASYLLNSEHYSSLSFKTNSETISNLAKIISMYEEIVEFDKARQVGGLAAELRAAVRELENNTQTVSQVSVESVIKEFHVPDNLDDLEL